MGADNPVFIGKASQCVDQISQSPNMLLLLTNESRSGMRRLTLHDCGNELSENKSGN